MLRKVLSSASNPPETEKIKLNGKRKERGKGKEEIVSAEYGHVKYRT